jgi:hypothetical protein
MLRLSLILITILSSAALFAAEPLPIQDNSFLIEEAYNQESHVVQHIFTYQRDRHGAFGATFTQEWPVTGIRHQLSYTLPYTGRHVNDVAINYRYQLLGDGDSRLALAPRLSYLGRDRALQINVPLSVVISPRVVTHWNAGATISRDAHSWSGGGSVIVAALPKVHAMLEVFRQDHATLISPGIRWAHDLAHHLQIVPGVAMPVDTRTHERSLYLYVSFEHPYE